MDGHFWKDAHGHSWTLMDAHGRSWTLMDGHCRDAHGRWEKLVRDGHAMVTVTLPNHKNHCKQF